MKSSSSTPLPIFAGTVLFLFALLACGMGERTRALALNSLWLSIGTLVIALPVGVFTAVVLTRTDMPGRRFGMMMFVALLFVPLYLHAAGWEAGFGRQGWYSYATQRMAEPPLAGWRGAMWVHAVAAIPWIVCIVSIGLVRVDSELEEQALLDAHPLRVLQRVTFRQVAPSILISALWIVVTIATDMTVTDIYQVRTYAEELYQDILLRDDWQSAWASIAPGVAMILGIAIFVQTAIERWLPPQLHAQRRSNIVWPLGRLHWPVLVFIVGVVLMAGGISLANLFYNIGLAVLTNEEGVVRSWSLAKAVSVIADAPRQFHSELGWSVGIGALGASVTVAVAAPLAWLWRLRARGTWLARVAFITCVAFPGPLIGLTLIWILNRNEPAWFVDLYDRTLFAPVVAVVIRSLPMCLLTCWFVFGTIADAELDQTQLDGATGWNRFIHFAVPRSINGLLVAWLISFTLATADLAASILVLPPGISTVPIRVFGLIHTGVDDQASALCLLSVTTFGGLFGIVAWLTRRMMNVR